MVLDVLSHRLFRCSGPSLAPYVTSFRVRLRGCRTVWLGRRASTLSRRLSTLNPHGGGLSFFSYTRDLGVICRRIRRNYPPGRSSVDFILLLVCIRFSEPLQQQLTKQARRHHRRRCRRCCCCEKKTSSAKAV